jgi:hypothetical protein
MNNALLPTLAKASLPQKYQAARLALSECVSIDECKDWSDKAAALASYAKQAGDEAMLLMAVRIQGRALKRCGELLSEIEKGQGKHWESKRAGDHPSTSTRKKIAAAAGLSPHQAKQAIRLANIPNEAFEAQIESKHPPTITALAKQGTAKFNGVPHYVQRGMTIKAFQAGMYFGGSVKDFAAETEKYDIADVVAGRTSKERKELQQHIKIIIKYLNKLEAKL